MYRQTYFIVFIILVMQVLIEASESDFNSTLEAEGRKKKGGGKKGTNVLPLLLIPFLVQAKIVPLMLMHMKLVAAKALLLGKLAFFLIFLNVVRNAILGTDYIDEQYEMQTLASQHYGYNGGPEYGAWINRRKRKVWKRQLNR
ncbi:uncharacterized protein [Rhodnius prolixus]|uniref:Uncharacterized protein n=1 Tax=Rhodnius prolixus TaxID=13249 RepID=T1ICH2_RHOPR